VQKEDIFVTKTGHFGHFNSSNFQLFKIGKSWIASGIRPRKDMNSFRPNVLKKGKKKSNYSKKYTHSPTFYKKQSLLALF
jgi:hypothetical protein